MPLTKWYDGLAQYQQQGIAHVLATVVAVNGSAPRELQSKMIVTLDACCDTLGGGSLEYDVTITARQLLNGEINAIDARSAKPLKEGKSQKAQAVRRDAVYSKHYPLGATLAQCCGGSVTVMFECFNVTPPMSLLVFGAGHVAAALMSILAELPCQVDWVDSRPEMFERYLTHSVGNVDGQVTYQLPTHIRPHIDEDPVDFIQPFVAKSIKSVLANASTKKGTQYFILVMTHDHSIDFDLVRATLDAYVKTGIDSSSLPYLGCISSAIKAKRFRDRLLQRDYSEQIVDKLTMPIGLNTGGKEPTAVAISIAAQVMRLYNDL
jgi:xanthine dehydrogenase accessory factor